MSDPAAGATSTPAEAVSMFPTMPPAGAYTEKDVLNWDTIGDNSAAAPTGGPGTSYELGGVTTYFQNIDDPRWSAEGDNATKNWALDDLNLGQLPVDEPAKVSCAQTCAEKAGERRKKCDILRKRVALALKKAGCPSKVTGFTSKTKTCRVKSRRSITPSHQKTLARNSDAVVGAEGRSSKKRQKLNNSCEMS
jgi:hypothetical protein